VPGKRAGESRRVTAQQLRECVKKAGVMVADVKQCLGK
jgi:hypothetical protein